MYYSGRFTNVRQNNFAPVFICDNSGFPTSLAYQRQQREYGGRSLYDKGFLVNARFMDKPNPQLLTPFIKADPRPVINSRDNIVIPYVRST
jgi:hypothetical protein